MSTPLCEICTTRTNVIERKNGARICKPCLDAFRRTFRVINRASKPVCKKRAKPRRVSVNRDAKYRRWLRWQFCSVVGKSSPWDECGFKPNDAAHTARTNGMSSKGPDSSCVPLCRKHHREYDSGRAAFEEKYGVSLQATAQRLYAQFLKETEK